METIDSTMEQEDISELPGGPTEVSDPAPMVLDEEEQLIVDEPAPRAAAPESFPAFSFTASPPLFDSLRSAYSGASHHALTMGCFIRATGTSNTVAAPLSVGTPQATE